MRTNNNPQIFAVIPTFNRIEYTKKCLLSFKKQNYKRIHVILVDSGSTDGTREFFSKNYPNWKLIKGNNSWWWTRATNEGIKYALKKARKKDFILEMNNDCFFDEGYVSQLLKTYKKNPNSIIGSLCVRHDRKTEVVEAGIRIHWPTGLVYSVAQAISNKLSYYKNMEVVKDIDALPGKGTLFPIKVFRKLGNYNFRLLPHYIADYELTNRAKRNGYELLVDTHAVVTHYWNATGLSSIPGRNYSYKSALKLLFGRKSMSNIVDWIVFIVLACPRKYLLVNFIITFQKLAKALFSIYPLHYLKPYIRFLLKCYWLMLDQVKKYLYISKLIITQFKKYHINKK